MQLASSDVSMGYEKDGFMVLIDGFELSKEDKKEPNHREEKQFIRIGGSIQNSV